MSTGESPSTEISRSYPELDLDLARIAAQSPGLIVFLLFCYYLRSLLITSLGIRINASNLPCEQRSKISSRH